MKKFTIQCIIYIMILIVLSIVTIFSAKGINQSRGKGAEDGSDASYRDAEEEYVKEIREILDEQGIKSAGVMLTSVTEEDGRKSYTLCVHHRIFGTEKLKSRTDRALRAIDETSLDVPGSRITVMTSA